jgi:hypothetical protein
LKLFDDAETSIKHGETLDPDNDQFPKLKKTLRLKRQAVLAAKKGTRQLDEAQKKEVSRRFVCLSVILITDRASYAVFGASRTARCLFPRYS